jgi:hypothetical protein
MLPSIGRGRHLEDHGAVLEAGVPSQVGIAAHKVGVVVFKVAALCLGRGAISRSGLLP